MIADCLVVLDDGRGRYGLIDASRIGPDGEWAAYAWAAVNSDRPRPFPSFSALAGPPPEATGASPGAQGRLQAHHPAGSGRPSS